MAIIRYKLVNQKNGNEVKVDCTQNDLDGAKKALFDGAIEFGLNAKDAQKFATQEYVWAVPGNVTRKSYMRILYASPLVAYVRKV